MPSSSGLFTPELYAHLRAIAGRIHSDHPAAPATLHPTALVHEAWLKIGQQSGYESRLHFLRAAAQAMRQVLVDHERARFARKRDGGARTTLSGVPGDNFAFDVIDLDRALTRLEELDPEGAEVVLLRCYGGLTLAEAAEVVGVSERTIGNRWRLARAWLVSNLELGANDPRLPG